MRLVVAAKTRFVPWWQERSSDIVYVQRAAAGLS